MAWGKLVPSLPSFPQMSLDACWAGVVFGVFRLVQYFVCTVL